jgi:hypothetical protein
VLRVLPHIVEVRIGAYVECNIVAVDGVGDMPVPLGVPIMQVAAGDKPAVRDVHQAVGHGDGKFSAFLRLVAPLVLAGEPGAAAVVLVGGDDPWPAGGVCRETQIAEAAMLDRRAVIADQDAPHRSLPQHFGKVDEDGAFVAGVVERCATFAAG